jgi:peroxiredoxin
MANPLTGDYEAVVQLAIRQINGLLGSLHQQGISETAKLKLLHRGAMRIGDLRIRDDFADFADWVIGFQQKDSPRGVRDLATHLTATAIPGVAKRFTADFGNLTDNLVAEIPPEVVEGGVKFQAGSAEVTVAPGSTSEITVHVPVRAIYQPDPGTTDLPKPLHGEVRATFEVHRIATSSGTRLRIRASQTDSKILFIGAVGAGLDVVEESRIAAEIRKVVRKKIRVDPIDLPATFPFRDFKGVGSGSIQAIALPLQLSGAALPNALNTISQAFIGSSGFAVAVSQEHATSLLDIEGIKEAIKQRTFRKFRATYHLHFSQGPTLDFQAGHILVSGRVEATTGAWWAPNGFVSFKQKIRAFLDSNNAINLARLGAPDVDESVFISHDFAVGVVRDEINNALANANPSVRQVGIDAKADLVSGLREFDASATATFTGVEIVVGGLVVRGEIGSGTRRAPIVVIGETNQNTAFTAYQSWIPAGHIRRYIWSWVERPDHLADVWGGVEKSFVDEHGFVFPKPAGITDVSRICLRIEGTQTSPGGQETTVAAGTTCEVQEPVIKLDAPSWWAPLTLPIWNPNTSGDSVMREAIAGHVGVQTNGEARREAGANTLVYFADWRAPQPLEAIGVALAEVPLADPLDMVVVLPAGAFDSRRREIEARLGTSRGRVRARIHLTEDSEGGWTQMFAPARTPSVYLINGRRELVWQYAGDPSPAELAGILGKHASRAPAARLRRLRLAVAPGDIARDVDFIDDSGRGGSLHRLRGRHALLNFWQAWSEPCLGELRRLQALSAAGKHAPVVIAFHGAAAPKGFEELRKSLGLTFALVPDPEHRVARAFGVRCWPTTIALGPDGAVEGIQLGAWHEHAYPPDQPGDKRAAT